MRVGGGWWRHQPGCALWPYFFAGLAAGGGTPARTKQASSGPGGSSCRKRPYDNVSAPAHDRHVATQHVWQPSRRLASPSQVSEHFPMIFTALCTSRAVCDEPGPGWGHTQCGVGEFAARCTPSTRQPAGKQANSGPAKHTRHMQQQHCVHPKPLVPSSYPRFTLLCLALFCNAAAVISCAGQHSGRGRRRGWHGYGRWCWDWTGGRPVGLPVQQRGAEEVGDTGGQAHSLVQQVRCNEGANRSVCRGQPCVADMLQAVKGIP